MNPQELRIGNNVYYNDEHLQKERRVITISYLDLRIIWHEQKYHHYNPIPLTEEWLLRFGFEKINHIYGYSFYSLKDSKINKCNITVYDNKTEYMGYLVQHCQYVHQLQNLYFALTGKELEIK